MADESFSLANDISKVAPICHGINIKMEKTGGPISTLKAIQAAQASNM